MKFSRIAAVLAAAVIWAAPAMAATVLAYSSIPGDRLAPAFVAEGISASDVHRGHGLVAARGNSFNSRDWTLGGSHEEALRAGDFLIWRFASATPLDLIGLDLGFRRSVTGPQSISLDITLDGSTWRSVYRLSGADFPALTEFEASIALDGFSGITHGAFRLTGWDADNRNGTFNFADSKAFDGHSVALRATPMAAIPLPPALPLLGAGVLVLALLRRRSGSA